MVITLDISNKILAWYDSNQRVLPWRDNKEPYRVWVSEIMLQQTRVDTVIPYFNRFLETLPTVSDLAKVPDDILNKLWEGLGYYSRAKNLKRAAIVIVDQFNGIVPQSRVDLEKLPGIGPYTSGAIASISFDERVPAIDGNVLRVFARYLGIKADVKDPKIKSSVASFVETKLPTLRVGDFNQALMEIGAIVCLPNGTPKCGECPLQKGCIAYHQNLTDMIPVKQKRIERKITDVSVFVFKHGEKIAIRKRPDTGLLAGLYEYPNTEELVSKEKLNKQYSSVVELEQKKHIFTHKEWNLIPFLIDVENQDEAYIWVTQEELNELYPLPTAFKKIKY